MFNILSLAGVAALMALPTYATPFETRPVPRPAVVHATAIDGEAAAIVAEVAFALGHQGSYIVYVDNEGLIRFQNPE